MIEKIELTAEFTVLITSPICVIVWFWDSLKFSSMQKLRSPKVDCSGTELLDELPETIALPSQILI